MKIVAEEYYQHKQRYLSAVMSVKTINDNSTVLIYGEHDYGYQRELDEKHIEKIKKNLINNQDSTLLPSSIILSIDVQNLKIIENKLDLKNDHDVNRMLEKYFILDLDKSTYGKELFRIVDGQHRLAGLMAAYNENQNEEFINFMLNVVILVIPDNNRSIEVNIFNDINSTQKKLKTDLIELVRAKYILLGETPLPVNDSGVVNYLSMEVANLLNESNHFKHSVWRNAIQLVGSLEAREGIIGVSAFKKSILPIIRFFYNRSELKEYIKVIEQNRNKIEMYRLNEFTFELAHLINDIWIKVEKKWISCFEDMSYLDEFGFRYSNDYYLQKTTGTNAIMRTFFDLMKEVEKSSNVVLRTFEERKEFIQEVINKFDDKITDSPIKSEDWKIGGQFAGLTSGTGFKMAVNMINPD